ncbi:MAG: TIGR02302 family protein, partial [Geminicoccales bacterium]
PDPLQVPIGSEVLAQVQGGTIAPELVIEAGERTLTAEPFETLATGSYKASKELTEGTHLTVRQDGRELGAWALEMVPDQVPDVEFFAPPARSERAALKLHYEANDDYGLAKVEALVRRLDRPDAEPLVIALPLPGGQPKAAENASYHDLTPHPWAGLAVEITLAAEDALGQRGLSDPVRTALPERIFNHPVARALVELRKQLTLDPEARYPVVRALSDLYERPEHFFHDILVALALKTAERRLIYDNSAESVPAVQQLLWDTALHIEDGELAISERDLRDKMQALMDALANNAEDAEIERLMTELQEALDRFLQAMAEQLRERMAQGEEPQPLPPGAEMLRSQDLQDLIDRARELAKNGARDAARQLLSQLQEMLENLRANPFAGGMDPQTEQAMKMMRDLESMTKRQQELLDRSYQRWQQGQQGEPGQQGQQGQQGQPGQPGQQGDPNSPSGQADALSQEQLRRELGELMRQFGDMMGDIPRPLGRAEQAMRDARDALEQEQSGEAIGPQTRALDQLQQGLQAMAEQMMKQFGQQQGPGGQGQMATQPGGMTRDPLGRESSDGRLESRDGVEIPSEMELRRAREILDELRLRRSERNRPEPELEYLDRLLRQF